MSPKTRKRNTGPAQELIEALLDDSSSRGSISQNTNPPPLNADEPSFEVTSESNFSLDDRPYKQRSLSEQAEARKRATQPEPTPDTPQKVPQSAATRAKTEVAAPRPPRAGDRSRPSASGKERVRPTESADEKSFHDPGQITSTGLPTFGPDGQDQNMSTRLPEERPARSASPESGIETKSKRVEKTSMRHGGTTPEPIRPAPEANRTTPEASPHTHSEIELEKTVRLERTPPRVQVVPNRDEITQDHSIRLHEAAERTGGTGSQQSQSGETEQLGGKNKDQDRGAEASEVDRYGVTDLKTVVKLRDAARAGGKASSGGGGVGSVYASVDAQLKRSEVNKLAQNRINELEAEVDKLRRENEDLAAAGETLGRRTDELIAKTETLESHAKETNRTHEEERKVFLGQLQQKERENIEMRSRVEEMEIRLENNFQKIRNRERQLENQLMMARLDTSTLVNAKDKLILDLKRQIDQLTHENESVRKRTQDLYNQNKGKQETARRVVRALRIALTILEGEDVAGQGKKGE